MVARDGDGVGDETATTGTAARAGLSDADVLLDVYIDVRMGVAVVVRVNNLVGKLVDALAEGVEVT